MARTPSEKTRRGAAVPPTPPRPAPRTEPVGEPGGLRPWHLLGLATLVAVAAGVVVTRGTPVANTVTMAVLVVTAAFVAAAAARTIVPLLAPDAGERVEMIGGRTRAALEREKSLVLRSIKDAEFDRAMKKISDADFQEMSVRLRSRAAGILRQLDGEGRGYRALIERDLAARLGPPRAPDVPVPAQAEAASVDRACPVCGLRADPDARFCKSCGAKIEEAP
ncbi:MAG TPA: zinc ribbon domain-containing protein [Vicinamibacterales bacterium]|nr:zinc ribbon domain-containing protein [Vicinamibacterales bacterium]HOG29903.1 zinc ribbon domain-containing protein [Vicinamibacterales bacterium]HOQ61180.1 zinc ribbon domain-containing protein [Vicinamibacterales bacterium]HPK71327.1 zinc ribbon domain-containing protein [Vicinamibacterales bacterium]HPW21462.1 zinc ribbon domain-containing protein [Vicinamibacterales bacterium]